MERRSIPYTSNERRVVDYRPGMFGGPDIPILNTPVNPRENARGLYFDKHPYWVGTNDTSMPMPAMYNLHLGRSRDDTDIFGRFWQWVESAGGSITPHGQPLFTNVNEWKDHIKIPNLDEWDWEKAAEDLKLDTRLSNCPSLVNGFWFERMISWMDFMNAAEALIDEDQYDAIHEMFTATTELACKVVDKLCDYWPAIDGINVHDDWGSQKAPFFSEDVARELFLPYMKQLNDHIHSKGRYTSLHSCGRNESRTALFIEAGYDEWNPQPMNDTVAMYEAYGDKIVLSIAPPSIPEGSSDEDYKMAARDFVDKFCKPGKAASLGMTAMRANPVFVEEIYEYSRKRYAGLV
ncbi:MAG: methyltransferase [Oscillospiraceae bacterium]|nr:methyltransferase [Oscillospiraceae bacterium]